MMNNILEASQSYSYEDSVFNLARRCNLLINNMLLVEWIISKRCTQEARRREGCKRCQLRLCRLIGAYCIDFVLS